MDVEQGKTYYKTKISLLELMTLLIIFVRFFDPLNYFIGVSGGYVLYYGMFLTFFFLATFFVKGFFSSFIYGVWPLIMIITMIILRSIYSNNLGFGFSDPMRLVLLITNLIMAYSLYLYIRNRGIKFKRNIVLAFLISITFSAMYSAYYVINIDYLAVRNATSVDLGVGDFNLIYAMIFIPVFLVLNIFNNTNKFKKVKAFLVFAFIVSSLLMIKANFMTALLLYVINIAILIFYGIGHERDKPYKYFAIFFLLVILLLSKDVIGRLIIEFSQSGYLSWVINKKLIVLGELLLGIGNDLETLGIRIEKISYTLNSFFRNPFFGISYRDYNALTIGGHSQWFDDMARFGIVGFSIWFLFFLRVFKNTLKEADNYISKKSIKVSWLIFFILGFLNPNIISSVTMVLLAIVPMNGYLTNYKVR